MGESHTLQQQRITIYRKNSEKQNRNMPNLKIDALAIHTAADIRSSRHNLMTISNAGTRFITSLTVFWIIKL